MLRFVAHEAQSEHVRLGSVRQMSLPRTHKIQYGRGDFQGFAPIFRDLAFSKSLRTLTADCVVFGRLDDVSYRGSSLIGTLNRRDDSQIGTILQ